MFQLFSILFNFRSGFEQDGDHRQFTAGFRLPTGERHSHQLLVHGSQRQWTHETLTFSGNVSFRGQGCSTLHSRPFQAFHLSSPWLILSYKTWNAFSKIKMPQNWKQRWSEQSQEITLDFVVIFVYLCNFYYINHFM